MPANERSMSRVPLRGRACPTQLPSLILGPCRAGSGSSSDASCARSPRRGVEAGSDDVGTLESRELVPCPRRLEGRRRQGGAPRSHALGSERARGPRAGIGWLGAGARHLAWLLRSGGKAGVGSIRMPGVSQARTRRVPGEGRRPPRDVSTRAGLPPRLPRPRGSRARACARHSPCCIASQPISTHPNPSVCAAADLSASRRAGPCPLNWVGLGWVGLGWSRLGDRALIEDSEVFFAEYHMSAGAWVLSIIH
ncbi:hypothetical protein C8Q78DRAFT_306157 [Trametes maxima]|nr:hypothetical protein C8Q78DRAFT_306157 [Trametes maxima]